MNMERREKIIEIMQDYADVVTIFRHACTEIYRDSACFGKAYNSARRALAYAEGRYAEDIDMACANRRDLESYPKAIRCPDCGQWTIDEYCQCAPEEASHA